MAHMVPSLGPASFAPESLEDLIYNALSLLSDDYWVVHSFKMVGVTDEGSLSEREADFVVFNKRLGILVIEAKAGQVQTIDGVWCYGNGTPMKHGGPYRQASDIKWALYDRFEDMGLSHLRGKCKLVHAVWFPSIHSSQLGALDYSSEAARELTLCKNDLGNPGQMIQSIMSFDVSDVRTHLSDREAREILDKIIRPEFKIVPINAVDYGYSNYVFARLLDEQVRVLDFLQEQKSAAINGAAGTGKTLVAIEHAKRISASDRVLFLCFNRLLSENIKQRCSDFANIDVYTIDALCMRMVGNLDFGELVSKISENTSLFPYRHVVVDEGQDFGQEAIEEADVLGYLSLLVEERGGTIYFFYDRRQLVQGVGLPRVISDSDCRLTLYRNCRNTENIARCSLRSLNDNSGGQVLLSNEPGNPPLLKISSINKELESFVDDELCDLRVKGLTDVVVLTCKTLERSAFGHCFCQRSDSIHWKDTSARIYTCRTFKGLEADAVVLIDVDETLWDEPISPHSPKEGLLFYTGASRAKYELRVAACLTETGCRSILSRFGIATSRRPIKKFAQILSLSLV